jgi:hydroxymethylglutaryl-CoA lyase
LQVGGKFLGNSKIVKNANWPRQCRIFEVGPRDGLQAESRNLGIEEKIKLVSALIESGISDIEIGSFVKSDRIPQLANTDDLIVRIKNKFPNLSKKTKLWAFVPNEKGLEKAVEHKLDGVGFFIATSDTFCQKNVNRSLQDLRTLVPILLKSARKNKIKNRVYLSTLVFCPYEGIVKPNQVFSLVEDLIDSGANEIVLSDTTGDANPRLIRRLLEKLVPKYGAKKFSLHLHDTRGLALANILEGMSFGISTFDSSVAGLGGCPYAPGASGNLSTEDLANMLLGMGCLKGVDLSKLAKAGFIAENLLGRQLPSRMLRALESKTKGAES